MKVITIESSAYRTMLEQIAEIAGYVREAKEERRRKEAETKDRLLNTAQAAELEKPLNFDPFGHAELSLFAKI